MNKLRSARPQSASEGKYNEDANEGADDNVDGDDLSDDGAVYTYRTAPSAHSPPQQTSPYKYSPRGQGDVSPRVTSSVPTPRGPPPRVDEAFTQPAIAVSLVESVLGTRSEGKDGAEEDYYVVEVDSDED